ncbi:30S ribosomal protein S16 [Rapidithrix thailandica]|uniref:Small ribosomal subunit protein bS16 n=1 Tax=Rapidithrix thailandica TaxID=413964 RepID=A0AAW9S2T4_9BACT
MPVKIRLARRGRKKRVMYDIVIADSRSPRDGRFIEKIGNFNPNVHPAYVRLDTGRALHWLMVGAQPTDTTRSLLSRMGIMLKKHLQVGVNKGAITQEVADKRFEEWKKSKDFTNLIDIVDEQTALDAGEVLTGMVDKTEHKGIQPIVVKEEAPKEEAAPAEEEAKAEEAATEEAPATEEASAEEAPAEENKEEEKKED